VHTVLRNFTATRYFARVYSLINRCSYGMSRATTLLDLWRTCKLETVAA